MIAYILLAVIAGNLGMKATMIISIIMSVLSFLDDLIKSDNEKEK